MEPFRENLFHRLNVIRLRLPALRERKEDVPMLTQHFLQQSARQLGVEPKRMSGVAMNRLQTFGFPGNVRQLENICHWLTVMAPAQQIALKDLPPEVLNSGAVTEVPALPVLRSLLRKWGLCLVQRLLSLSFNCLQRLKAGWKGLASKRKSCLHRGITMCGINSPTSLKHSC